MAKWVGRVGQVTGQSKCTHIKHTYFYVAELGQVGCVPHILLNGISIVPNSILYNSSFQFEPAQ
ncbi:hypothetical protein Hanom_Chr08g00754111 [Helianthus anomalus]